MKRLGSFLWLSSVVLILAGCAKDNEEELVGNTSCNSANMTFTSIKPILQNACFSCHGNGQSQNGINFDSYAGVKVVADNGKLVGSITHAAGFKPMPQGAPKLSDCDINKIKDWVSRGALNN